MPHKETPKLFWTIKERNLTWFGVSFKVNSFAELLFKVTSHVIFFLPFHLFEDEIWGVLLEFCEKLTHFLINLFFLIIKLKTK